ncbi:MAG: sigma-54-dependent Fis family transcriptional regulator [Bacteroidetes bacterium]|nr:MAG: sigma-54-dependent Fis family transcriptional regulator [Bacteroidota bacterium]
MAKLLIIDDEEVIRYTLKEILEYEDYTADEASNGTEGLDLIMKNDYDVVLCDIKMPGMDGLEVLERAIEKKPDTQFIMISGHGTIETAVEATKKGAYDFLEKPPDLNRLLVTIRNAMDKSTLVTETKRLRRKITKTRKIIGQSPVMEKIQETIDRVAATDARVLITGSNGTGKELVARWIHEKSTRADGPLVEVNCAAIPSELIESELFGHEKGSFTGAYKQRIGKFEQANGGTLFLDEIGDMSLSAQAKVLRALQENKITRIGSDKQISVDVRIISATNKDLLHEIEENRFREDLYHRLSVILIHVPPLRERKEDIPLIAREFLREIADEYGMPNLDIEEGAMQQLMRLEWTGNVRELHNVIERLAILSNGTIKEQDVLDYAVPQRRRKKGNSIFHEFNKFQSFKDHIEKQFILHKLEANNWNISKTAEMLEIQRSHLYNKMEKYGIKRES